MSLTRNHIAGRCAIESGCIDRPSPHSSYEQLGKNLGTRCPVIWRLSFLTGSVRMPLGVALLLVVIGGVLLVASLRI